MATRTLLRVALAVLVAACSTPTASGPGYFNFRARIGLGAPVVPGTTVYAGVEDVETHGSDRIVFVSADADGIPTGDQTWSLLRRSKTGGGGIGIVDEAALPPELLPFSRVSEPLAGATLTATDGLAQLVLIVHTSATASLTATVIHLRYRVNNGPEREEDVPTVVRICSGVPAPESCDVPSAS